MKLSVPLSFDWDKGNIDKNWGKHKVRFKETEEVFLDKPLKIFPDKKHSTSERRFQALGITNNRRNLTIFFITRDNKIRVISARDQNKKERRKYE
ncbi:MAG: BrnT family toxin [Patescibacteria group bacterium]